VGSLLCLNSALPENFTTPVPNPIPIPNPNPNANPNCNPKP